ncbi:fluoride efflux transporter FluC [Caldalkalibacillus salinus]|uniref:fluoride efflux transporter FluC n=1 Tax=Caldalkalibacillus salinus TaxID=2803787 RepID=UPI001F01B407|nr:CrcB family protein [Caldalkalibacillus salinus]
MNSKVLIGVGTGGAVGALLRYMISNMFMESVMFYSTLLVNLLGSLILGGLTGFVLARQMQEWLKASIGVGFCGGFTTMSTFALDVVALTQQTVILGMIYVVLSIFGGIACALMGLILGEWIGHNRAPKDARTE